MIEAVAPRHRADPGDRGHDSTEQTWRDTLASWVGAMLGKEAYQDRINRDVLVINVAGRSSAK